MVNELAQRNHPDLLHRADWQDVATRYRLTARELGTLRMVCRGLSNADAAMALSVTRSTVRTHLRAAYDKLACTGRVDVILKLVHRYVKK